MQMLIHRKTNHTYLENNSRKANEEMLLGKRCHMNKEQQYTNSVVRSKKITGIAVKPEDIYLVGHANTPCQNCVTTSVTQPIIP